MPDPLISRDVHMEYTNMLPAWSRCRDCRLGEDAIKQKGETYLPKLGGQSQAEYDAYKQRARYFTAFNKTIDGHVGLATRKEPLLTIPDSMEEITGNIDRKGSDIPNYIKIAIDQVLEAGRCGTLVDYPKVGSDATMADTNGARPYWTFYLAEDIRDWEFAEDGKLVYVLLREKIDKRGGGNNAQQYRYRACEIIEGVYTQRVWVDGEEEMREEVIPQMNGGSLDFIPFQFHQPNFEQKVSQPPLLDLANMSISHYQLKADHRHALHYVALPTPYIIGIDADDEKGPNTIGPQKIWKISETDASVGMLEFTGQGVTAIENELKSMEDQMAILGSRVLLPELSEHTATASKLRSISETSDLSSIVIVLDKQFNILLDWTAEWSGASPEAIEITMDSEFLPKELDAPMLTALVKAWQDGAYDYETLIDNLKKAELIDADQDVDELKSAVEDEDEERMLKAAEAIAANTAAEGGAANDDEEDPPTNGPES